MRRRIFLLGLATVAILGFVFGGLVFAGGPLVLTGPGSPQQGIPYVWDPAAMPVHYTVDSGPLSIDPSGRVVVNNAAGLARVASMFQTWQSVPTTAIRFAYAGTITASGLPANPDIATVADYNAVVAACNAGTQTPIIFDANGSIRAGLGIDPGVIGFGGPCRVDLSTGHILSALVLLNGEFQDGVESATAPNYEITSDEFDQAITHEMGHFAGLDHSQINEGIMTAFIAEAPGNCDLDNLAGLPLMFPVLYCQSRVSAGLPPLAPDDMAWISKLYPAGNYSSSYGTISGLILFSDGVTQVQGINVIARRVDDPSTTQDESKRVAMSVVSGFSFTGNPGQPFSGDNTGGSVFGSRNPAVIGYYEIPVTPGTYTVQAENIYPGFVGGSSVGPLGLPYMVSANNEYWHQYESAFDDESEQDPITVGAGQTVTGISIILNGTPPRFDQFEDGALYRCGKLFERFWARAWNRRAG